MQFESLNHFKSIIAFQFFVGPADDDYLVARWQYLNGFSGFYWNAAQAIEKYLKASLILNGCDVKPLGHKIKDLFDSYKAIYGHLCADTFHKPATFENRLWRDEAVRSFIVQVNEMGRTDSRYGLTSWTMEPQNLVKFDLLCRDLRRCCVGLNWIVGEGVPPSSYMKRYAGEPFLQVLTLDQSAAVYNDFKSASQKLEQVGSTRNDLRMAWNFAQADEAKIDLGEKPLTLASEIGWMRNSRLFLLYQNLSKRDERGKRKPVSPIIVEGTRWLLDNVQMDKEISGELRQLVQPKRVTANKRP